MVSLYWATATTTTVGYGDIHAHTDLEVSSGPDDKIVMSLTCYVGICRLSTVICFSFLYCVAFIYTHILAHIHMHSARLLPL